MLRTAVKTPSGPRPTGTPASLVFLAVGVIRTLWWLLHKLAPTIGIMLYITCGLKWRLLWPKLTLCKLRTRPLLAEWPLLALSASTEDPSERIHNLEA